MLEIFWLEKRSKIPLLRFNKETKKRLSPFTNSSDGIAWKLLISLFSLSSLIYDRDCISFTEKTKSYPKDHSGSMEKGAEFLGTMPTFSMASQIFELPGFLFPGQNDTNFRR